MNILLFRDLPVRAVDEVLRIVPGATVRQVSKVDELPALLDGTQVIFGNPPPKLLLGRAELRWLQIVSSGIDEYQPLAGTGVQVTTAHGVHSAAIAQHTLMTILMLARGQLYFAQRQREAKWDRLPSMPLSLRGQTIGFVGYGSIARELVAFTSLLGLRAIGVKRESAACPFELMRLDTLEGLDALLVESDHVVITVPLTTATRGLLDARRIALLKRGGCVYNVARGGLLDEDALRARLLEGSLRGAAIDVFATEPLPPESPWWSMPNCIVTPHVAGHHRDLGRAVFERFLENLECYVAGEPLRSVANFARQY